MKLNFTNYILCHCSEGNYFTELEQARMALYFAQNGRCLILGTPLLEGHRHLHHRLPVSKGGSDRVENLVLLTDTVHELIHTQEIADSMQLLATLKLNTLQMRMVNQLRYEAFCTPISMTDYLSIAA